jgi:hypothetical protein
MRCLVALVALVATVACLSGCGYGGAGERDDARATVERFYAAIRAGDGNRACNELSGAAIEQLQAQTQQTCSAVITRLEFQGGEVARVDVAIVEAEVVMSTTERAFLGREPGGWKLDAIGCEPASGLPRQRPADCEVQV